MDGVINVCKPKGISSFQVVRELKKLTGKCKIGHTGTLDPLASGVLPICIGKATKITEYIMENHKVYVATLKLGQESDTYDLEGTIISTKEVKFITDEEIKDILSDFTGEIMQVPPMYSALKQGGKRLYELARQGIEVEREPRKINIYNIELLKLDLPFVTMRVKCSKGTYVRSLCKDIGDKVGCGAIMTELIREETGPFSLSNAVDLNNINNCNIEDYLLPIEKVLSCYEKIEVDDKFFKLLYNGVSVKDKFLCNDKICTDKLYRVYSDKNIFLGLGKRDFNGFKIMKLLL